MGQTDRPTDRQTLLRIELLSQLKTMRNRRSRLRNFFNSNHTANFLDFSYFVNTQLLKKIWVELVHRAPNGGVLKIAPPNFSFINLTDSCKFQDFLKKWNAHIFFIFKARLLIFWVIGHVNDLVTWYDCHDDRTRLSPDLGCGSLRHPPWYYHGLIPHDW